MLKNIGLFIIGLMVTIFIGSLFVWAIAAFVGAIVFAVVQNWGFVALFGIAAICWFASGAYFMWLPRHASKIVNPAGTVPDTITPVHRRVAAAFGLVMGTALGFSAGIVLMIFAMLSGSSQVVPVAVMVLTIVACLLLCYVLPNVGPEILNQLASVADVI